MRRKGLLAAGLAAAAIAASAGTAQAAVTIGSNLAGTAALNDPGCDVATGLPCTATNLSLPAGSQAPGGLTSPVNGTVTSWSASANVGDGLRLQVMRQVSGITYQGISTSAPGTWSTGISPPFATSLPIKIGDSIGLQDTPGERLIYASTPGATAAAWYVFPLGPLADGSTRTADATGANREALVQATIEPTNTITVGAITRNKKKGTATVGLTVPNPGQLSYSGTGVNVTGPASVAAPGDIRLTVRATGKKRKKLNKKGKVSVSFGTTFTPNFGAAGITPTNLTLRKKHKRK